MPTRRQFIGGVAGAAAWAAVPGKDEISLAAWSINRSFFVNHRWVQHRGMTFALEEAYHSLLMVGRHPTAVVSLAVPPHLVDVNVHPTKQEVRFVHDRDIPRMLGATVRAALLGNATAAAVPLVSLPSAFSGGNRDFARGLKRWVARREINHQARFVIETDRHCARPRQSPLPSVY